MKKHLITLAAMLLTLMAATTACSDNGKVSDLLDRIPAETDIVATGNIRTIIESAGGTVDGSTIKLPKFILDEFDSREASLLEELQDYAKEAAIDPEACAIAGNLKDPSPIILFHILDTKKFANFIEDKDFDEFSSSDDITFYRRLTYTSSWDNSKYWLYNELYG